MKDRRKIQILAVLAVLSMALFAMAFQGGNAAGQIAPAPNFTATDHLNRTFSLDESAGTVTIIHVTQLESPLCIECEAQMQGQIRELARLSEDNGTEVSIITFNIRKNSYSDEGWQLAKDWYGINATWHWVEEYEPFPSASLYQKYWEVDNSFANPSLIMIDAEQNVVGVYHVYCIGTGELDGVQTAESLSADVAEIQAGEWNEFRGEISPGITLAGMFLLGILTSLSPCSVALLIVMISYIGSGSGNAEPKVARKRGFGMGMLFTLGMTLTFFLIGLLVAYVGLFIEMSAMFYLIVGIILVILGINAIKPLNLTDNLRRLFRKEQDAGDEPKNTFMDRISKRSEYLGAFILGLLFTIGWAPCAMSLVFPVLVMMLTQEFTVLTGGIMMAAFGLGHGIIIVPICTATGDVKGRLGNKLVKAGKWVQPGFGIVIILMGLMFAVRFWGWNLW
ncbi:MAG: cytochrome c biogenesis CcdA family protein [Candidatus Thermoplasmatota archaeon]|nr:cytochrome c biogenesis protein CcdA [Euryarchaeota archaeon]MBU4031830.1 cytochrome c biogenesis CcdA family protein [Candidatus Thermoplasmatota archaeon]MBU4071070.1 cytochrome c biogenesis CcdA family protein [Candidatus Thermoplasmatota archaeon]MBU4145191.1 cytochrome c biogenesis CcdA family protein [Candidatus Thermoplasmatota archaeon]MBU4591142.1 cytochrome c biogenesis CcdA family protein [Candidatus Thermoplasmatota archaeon]